MAEVKAARLSGYYGELKKFIENSNYNKVIKVANKILAEDVKEVKAWQCKTVALINLDQFSDALATVIKSKFFSELAFEKAYCEYRLNKVADAFQTIQGAAQSTPKVLELQAQILYRLERYDECHEVYRDIIRTTSDDFDMERETNMTAVLVNRTVEGGEDEGEVPVVDDSASYELIYNGACRLLAAGKLEQALEKLQSAEEQCRTYLTQEEGATEDEVNEEVAIIRVQQGHCLQHLGREREALAIYNSVLKTKPDDPALLAIINNNLVSINRTANVFDSRKRMKAATASGLEHKLTTRQRSTIALNHCLLAYHTNQEEVCRTESQALLKEYPLLTLKARVIQAAQLGREGKLNEAQALLNGCIKEYPQHTTEIQLMTIQILLAKGDKQAACTVLSSLPDKDRNRPGVVSALVALQVAQGDRDAASKVLREAVEWHQNNKTSASQLGELWRHAADFHLRTGDAATAASSLLELHKLNPHDTTTLAQLITAYARYDLKAAQKLSRELPGVGSVVEGLDVETLESALGHRYFKKMQQGRGEASPSSPKAPLTPGLEQKKPVDKKKAKKKKRKPRLPKDYNPAMTPDPERWLPRWQRKGYRKKKDRRVKEVMKGTQGVSSEAADKFDITKTAGTHKPAQAAMSPQPESQGPRRNLIKKKGGGKKKKGSGW